MKILKNQESMQKNLVQRVQCEEIINIYKELA